MSATACDVYEGDDTLTSYVAKTLDDDSAAGFEDHLLMCERCQRSVRALTIVRDLGPRVVTLTPHRKWGWAAAAATGLLAAGLAGVALWSSDRSHGLNALGVVNIAPVYQGAQMRAAPSANALTFDSAMQAYGRGDYAAAVALLDRAGPFGADAAPADFFRGAAHLMLGHNQEAAHAFGNVIAAGPNPYLAEAHFYRAKARLRMGDREGASADLRTAAASASAVASEARRILIELGG